MKKLLIPLGIIMLISQADLRAMQGTPVSDAIVTQVLQAQSQKRSFEDVLRSNGLYTKEGIQRLKNTLTNIAGQPVVAARFAKTLNNTDRMVQVWAVLADQKLTVLASTGLRGQPAPTPTRAGQAEAEKIAEKLIADLRISQEAKAVPVSGRPTTVPEVIKPIGRISEPAPTEVKEGRLVPAVGKSVAEQAAAELRRTEEAKRVAEAQAKAERSRKAEEVLKAAAQKQADEAKFAKEMQEKQKREEAQRAAEAQAKAEEARKAAEAKAGEAKKQGAEKQKNPVYKALDIAVESPNDYQILGLEKGASFDTVKKAWRQLTLKWHPDKNPGNEAFARQVFDVVNEAYNAIKTAEEAKSK